FIVGEGSGVLILEALEFALRRGATILAEVVGYGMSGDAYHITQPAEHGDGGYRVTMAALKDAGISPGDVGYVNAHGTSTPIGDAIETEALKRVFGEKAKQVPISSTKSMTGHLLGGAGGLEAGISVLALRDQILPPTINYETPDPACDLDYVPNQARKAEVEYVASNSFGFGGTNASLVFRRWSGK
ncbi:MAG: beta-ketoacyl-ACP synthase II, partial [Candidatus Acidiferrales bacterium]